MRNRYQSWLWAVSLLWAAFGTMGCSDDSEPAKGQLMLSLQTDMAIPKDIDQVRLEVSVYGSLLFANSYDVGVGGLKIPATIGLVAGQDPSAPVTIRVIARQKGKLRVLREVITTVPPDRVALLRIPIQWLCQGQATEPTAGQVESTCPEEQTCVAGRCEDRHVDSASFPAYRPQDVYGGAAGPDLTGGQCLDTLGCFAQGYIAMVDSADCSFAKPLGGVGLNVAVVLALETEGICGDYGCLIPLDAQGAGGWTEVQGRIRLAPAICDRIAQGNARGVAVTTSCATKTEAIPTCGPWSSVPGTSTADAGAPDGSLEPLEAGAEAGLEAGPEAESAAPCTDPSVCCVDGIKDGNETDIDCGGDCPNKCAGGKTCGTAGDCLIGYCNSDHLCTCPGDQTHSPAFVTIEERYCIDSTEVTHAQYMAWLQTSPQTSGQPSYCEFNSTYVPDASCLNGIGQCSGLCPNDPQICVDWCDAQAFCVAMGKTLCGMPGGAPIPYQQTHDMTQDQWYNACSSGGQNEYPYGNTYDANTCNGIENTATGCAATGQCVGQPVGSLQGCQSSVPGYQGVWDLSGNVAEWVNECDGQTGATDTCMARGGSFSDAAQSMTCAWSFTSGRGEGTMFTGFRCCNQAWSHP